MNAGLGDAGDIIGILVSAIFVAAMLIWVERRLLAVWQDRLGPNRVGPFGLMQVVADMIKMFFKEDWIPPFSDKLVFVLAPTIVFITMLTGFAVIPFAPGIGIIDFNFGLLYFLALSSLSVYSVVLAGYASNSKYPMLGALRAAAQTVSYEVFMGISIMGVVMLSGTFNLREIVEAQRNGWFIIPQFFGFIIFLIAIVAESRRAPLDLPEAEQELVGGFHTVFRHEIRHVLRRRIFGHYPELSDHRDSFFRWLAGPLASSIGLVLSENRYRYHVFHIIAWGIATPTL